jgi:ABC-type tungstate transport system permease subunit
VLIGPESDPAGVKGKDIVTALQTIKAKQAHLTGRPLRGEYSRDRTLEGCRH